MRELIAHAPDMASFTKAAQATGFVKKGEVQTSGTWPGSKGGWFLAVVPEHMEPTGNMIPGPLGDVPEMAPVPGVFARLRWNDEAQITRLNAFLASVKSQGLTIYERKNVGTQEAPEVIWTSDGVTPGPSYLDNIGVIL